MANYADYMAHVRGDYLDVVRFIHLLFNHGPLIDDPYRRMPNGEKVHDYIGGCGYTESGAALISYEFDDNGEPTGKVVAVIDDSARWNCEHFVLGDGRETRHPVVDLCKVYGLEFELYSHEPGNGFSEHFYVDSNGDVLVNDVLTDDDIASEGDMKDVHSLTSEKAIEKWYDEFERRYSELYPWEFSIPFHDFYTQKGNGLVPYPGIKEFLDAFDPHWDLDTHYPTLKVFNENN